MTPTYHRLKIPTYHRLMVLVPHLDAELVSCPIGGATNDIFVSYHSVIANHVYIVHSDPSSLEGDALRWAWQMSLHRYTK